MPPGRSATGTALGHANLSLGPSAWRVECGISCVKVKTLRRRPRRDRPKAGPPLLSRNSLYPVPARLLPCGLGRDRRPHANQPFAGSGTGRKDARSGLTGVVMAPRFRPDRLVRAQRQGAVGEERAACAPDVHKFCESALQDTMRVLACLQANRPKISAACNRVLVSHGQ